jgi:uncharacterized protein (DUF58 family)
LSQGTALNMKELIRLRAAARGLELSARRRALSVQAGGYLSAYRGRGLEFDEVRAYQGGDDARSIDWRVTARRGQPYTKLFREERERPVLLLVDLHPGMYFGSRQQFKSVLAGHLAALLAWAAARSGDRLGGVVSAEAGHREIHPAPRETGVLRLLRSLVQLQPAAPGGRNPGRLDGALKRLVRVALPGSMVVVLSDFAELGDEADKYFGALARHNDLIGAFLYDPLEADPPPPGNYRMGVEGEWLSLDTARSSIVSRWRQQFHDHRESVKGLCRRHGAHYMEAATAAAPLRSLQLGLARHRGAPDG